MPDAEKRARADVVIDTGTDHATTQAAVADLVARIRAGDPPPWIAPERA
jgi:dephospho-CoA kinase